MGPDMKSAPVRGGSKLQRFVAPLVSMSVASLVLVAAQAVAPQSSPVLAPTQVQAADFGGLDVVNGNSGGKELHVCKDWGWPSGIWYAKTCKSDGTNGAVQRLKPGQRSTQGDTDGIHVPKGYKLQRWNPSRAGAWRNERGCVTNANEWTKVQPTSPWNNVNTFRIVKC